MQKNPKPKKPNNPKPTVGLVPPGLSVSCSRGVTLVPKLQAVAEVGEAS